MTMAALKPTEDQLRAAWQARRRRDWPESFEAAMNDPTYSRILCIEVRRREGRKAQAALTHHQPLRRALPALPSMPPVLDHKRRAAGERDDD